MLSQKARYALRALVELARMEGAQLTAGELALRADAPRKFLEAILLELSRNRVVTSRRGKFGGYVLARPALEISFAEVIRVVDGPLAMASCVSPRLGYRKCDDCPDGTSGGSASRCSRRVCPNPADSGRSRSRPDVWCSRTVLARDHP